MCSQWAERDVLFASVPCACMSVAQRPTDAAKGHDGVLRQEGIQQFHGVLPGIENPHIPRTRPETRRGPVAIRYTPWNLLLLPLGEDPLPALHDSRRERIQPWAGAQTELRSVSRHARPSAVNTRHAHMSRYRQRRRQQARSRKLASLHHQRLWRLLDRSTGTMLFVCCLLIR